MIYTWEIYTDTGTFLGYEYSISENGAKQAAFNKHGSASRYTGIGMENITATRIN
mgnify:CR=1 FL=1